MQVLDEADYFLLDGTEFDEAADPGWTIFGLTATPIKREQCMEKELLKQLGYELMNSCVAPVHE